MHSTIGAEPLVSSAAPTCVSSNGASVGIARAAMRTPVEPVSTSMLSTVTHCGVLCVPGTQILMDTFGMLMLPIDLSTVIVAVLSPVAGGDEFPGSVPEPCGVQSGVAFQPTELLP